MTITKRDIAEDVARETRCHKYLAAKMVDHFFATMRNSLINDYRIEIRGFAVFQVKKTKPKPAARNPRTGKIFFVPARRKIHFKPGNILKDALNQQIKEQ